MSVGFLTNSSKVLNASRHQRNNHVDDDVIAFAFSQCSTPLGIKGTITRRRASFGTALARCSTPLGIKGTITFTPNSNQPSAMRAQRLSASKEQSQWINLHEVIRCCVLNASRHQRNNHINSCLMSFAVSMCSTPLGIKGTITP